MDNGIITGQLLLQFKEIGSLSLLSHSSLVSPRSYIHVSYIIAQVPDKAVIFPVRLATPMAEHRPAPSKVDRL